MKSLLSSLIALVVLVASGEAQVPRTISYQGFLCDTTGQPKPDATYALTFRLYDAASGGTVIWIEQKDLATKQGLFSTQLGDLVPFGQDVTFAGQYWLGIQVGTEEELSPRLSLSAIGNSFRAMKSDTALYADYAVRAARTDTAAYASVAGSGGSNPWQISGNDIYYNNGSVGIGMRSLSADLEVDGLNGVVFVGTSGSGVIPKEGNGSRMMWYPKKAAFRSGYAEEASWDDANIGWYSTATGFVTLASGNSATAMGLRTVASGTGATAMGGATEASGSYSTALGHFTEASGTYSTAMGHRVSTGGYIGSFIIGDNSSDVNATSSEPNQFMAVFAGGYALWTDRSGQYGAYMNGRTSGWSNISDRNKKENFRPVDGEELLSKIRSMSITEWNYKNSDPCIKYIGPVAQDFYSAFHLGGTDSLGINSICIDGVNMAAVQALERRTSELRDKTAELEAVKARVVELEVRLARLERESSMPKDITQRLSDERDGQR